MTDIDAVQSIAALMDGYSSPWGFCGGWAIDLFLNRRTRSHKDVDIATLRQDQAELYTHLRKRGWTFETAYDGRLTTWDGEWIGLPVHTLWCRNPVHDPSFLEVLLNEREGNHFVFRRDPTIRQAFERAFQPSVSGLPILAPEIVLLYKAKYEDEEVSMLDFENVLPHMSTQQRMWLRDGLVRLHAGHKWLTTMDEPKRGRVI